MNKFIRLVTRAIVDEYLECKTFEEKQKSAMITSLKEKKNISVFAASSSISPTRIIAAVCAPRKSSGRVTYAVIKDLGFLPEYHYQNRTHDEGVNKRHYEYKALSDSQMIKLADMIVKNTYEMNKLALEAAVRDSIKIGAMQAKDVNFLK